MQIENVLKFIIFSLNVIYVFNSADEKQIMSEIQFDVIMTSLPFEVKLYIDSSPRAKEYHFATTIQNFGKIP